jgi:hypothetical protein
MSNPRDKTPDADRQDGDKARDKEHLDEKLDEALEETFPASDPVAITPSGKKDPEPSNS